MSKVLKDKLDVFNFDPSPSPPRSKSKRATSTRTVRNKVNSVTTTSSAGSKKTATTSTAVKTSDTHEFKTPSSRQTIQEQQIKVKSQSQTQNVSLKSRIDSNVSTTPLVRCTSTSTSTSGSSSSLPRQRLKSNYCNLFRSTFKNAIWSHGIPLNDECVALNVIADIKEHIQSECDCVEDTPARLLLGNCHYELFILRHRLYMLEINEQENKSPQTQSSRATQENKTNLNDIPISVSQLNDVSIDYLPRLSARRLLQPLLDAMDFWRQALQDNKKDKTITNEMIRDLNILANVNSAYHAFTLHQLPLKQFQAAKMLFDLCQLANEKTIKLTATYYLVSVLIRIGNIKKATSILTRVDPTPLSSESLPTTFEGSLVFLAKCEIALRTSEAEAKSSALYLKQFLNSVYLQETMGIGKMYVKILALILASKYSSKHYQFTTTFREFLEQVQTCIAMLRRFNPIVANFFARIISLANSGNANSEPTPDKENQDPKPTTVTNQRIIVDPMWFQFAFTNLSLESLSLSCNFLMNCGLIADGAWYFNLLLKVAKNNCAFIWISKILIIGSKMDFICDHLDSANAKLRSASDVLDKCYGMLLEPETVPKQKKHRVSENNCDDVNVSVDEDEIVFLGEFESDGQQTARHDDSCVHENININTNAFNLRKLMANLPSSKTIKHDLELDTFDSHSSKLLLKDLQQDVHFNDIVCIFPDLYLLKLEISLLNIVNSDQLPHIALKMLNKSILVQFDQYSKSVLAKVVAKKQEKVKLTGFAINGNEFSIAPRLRMEIMRAIIKKQTAAGMFEDALTSYKKTADFISNEYETRVISMEIEYLQALSEFKIFLADNKQLKSFYIDYNVDFDVSQFKSDKSTNKSSTSTPTKSEKVDSNIKKSRKAPNAPKPKEYKLDGMKDYADSLRQKIINEREMEKIQVRSMTSSITSSTATIINSHGVRKRMPLGKKLDFDHTNSVSLMPSISHDDEDAHGYSNLETKRSMNINSFAQPSCSSTSIKSKSTSVFSSLKKSGLKVRIFSSSEDDEVDLDEVLETEVFDDEATNTKEEVKKEDECVMLSRVIKKLNNQLSELSYCPPVLLTRLVHLLLAELIALSPKSKSNLVAYHLAEAASATTFRFKHLFISEKKKKFEKDFTHKSFLPDVEFTEQNNYQDIERLMLDVPKEWIVVQMLSIENGTKVPDLLICRYEKEKHPIVIRVKGKAERLFKHFLSEFKCILDQASLSITYTDHTFWEVRNALDQDMKKLLHGFDNVWLGPFKGILMGHVEHKIYRNACCEFMTEIVEKMSHHGMECCNNQLLSVVINSIPILTFDQFAHALHILFKTSSQSLIKQCYNMFMSKFPVEAEDVKNMLIESKFSHVSLIVDNHFENFPFESLPNLLELKQQIFRVPSLRVLNLLCKSYSHLIGESKGKGLDEDKVYYLLNPANNLEKTEKFFREPFQNLKKTLRWEGEIGREPNYVQLKQAFETKDTFIFIGHGAGRTYFKEVPGGFDSMDLKCASLVMGCSSGRLFSDGSQLEPYSGAYQFLLNGCPCYVGCLWEVTDKEIDKVTDEMLNRFMKAWIPQEVLGNKVNCETNVDIASAVTASRFVCKLKLLTGASPVVYGLPLFAKI